MQLQERIDAFVKLGDFIRQFSKENIENNNKVEHNALFYDGFNHQLKLAHLNNGWFSMQNLKYALQNWANALTLNNLNEWLEPYKLASENKNKKTVAVIMAGNIPLVGFHDVLSVLITGHNIVIKQSSNDKQLLPYLVKYLEHVQPKFKGSIAFTNQTISNFDAVIATGSNNTARYFEYYFKDKPSIIRKNRNSVAVLSGNESLNDLKNLSEDIFRYFGLGCRNVSKLFVPKHYDFKAFFEAIYHWHPIIEYAKYANNYDYNKAVYLMSEFDMLENGFFMIKEDIGYGSPIATAFYEYYETKNALKEKLMIDQEHIQCIVSKGFLDTEIPFGHTQTPQLSDYADRVDSVKFLLSI